MTPNIESVCSRSILATTHKSKPTPNLQALLVVWSQYYRDVERCQGGSKPDFRD
ncbi:hypothetical protein P692DRAFT_20838857 [Suillus brevipes Sb2]|nr:hypothetical protein P692DRAFT_20838857 [Suillus brevipes Sb2]